MGQVIRNRYTENNNNNMMHAYCTPGVAKRSIATPFRIFLKFLIFFRK